MDEGDVVTGGREQVRLVFEHVDRRGQVRLFPLSRETQHFFAASIMGGPEAPSVHDEQSAHPACISLAESLTGRELQVLDLMIAGQTTKWIAHRLSISPRTVEFHRARLMRKMGVRNVAGLMRAALQAA